MARLIDIQLNKKVIIEPIKVEKDDDIWIQTQVKLETDSVLLYNKVIPLHTGDFENIFQKLSKLENTVDIEFIEPYIKFKIQLIEDKVKLTAFFNEGPIFNANSYQTFEMTVTNESINLFKHELKVGLNSINLK